MQELEGVFTVANCMRLREDCKFVHINQSFMFDERKNQRKFEVDKNINPRLSVPIIFT